MKRFRRIAAVSGIAVITAALSPVPSQAAPEVAPSIHAAPAGLVFVQTNAAAGNAVVVYDRAPDGTLHKAGTYQTGGRGGALTGAVVDRLGSQDSVTYDRAHKLLYTVNAGSNSVTVFSVSGNRLIRRETVSSGGSFPVSIAVHGNLVYVLNARNGGSVQGFLRVGTALVKVRTWHRGLGLDPAQTPEFTSTPGDVAFSPDGSKLLVATKANGSTIDVFRVGPLGTLSTKPVVNADPGNVPFAIAFDSRGHVVVAEAGPNAVATFTMHSDGTIALVDRQATGQAATCWVVTNGTTFYASNAGSGTVSAYRDNGNGQLQALGRTGTDPGTVDAAVSSDKHYLYVQTGANGNVDEYRIGTGGALTRIGSVTVPDSVGGEGIAAS